MGSRLIMFCYGVFVIGTLLSLAISGRWFEAGEINVINQLAGYSAVEVQAMGGWSIAKGISGFFTALSTILGWNYPYLNNSWGWIFKACFLYPVTIGVVFSVLEVAATVIQGIASTIRSLLPLG